MPRSCLPVQKHHLPAYACNCQRSNPCPLDGKCRTKCIVYKATVTAPTKSAKIYYGLAETDFKARYRNHTSSFRNENHRHDTELSKYMWTLQEQGLQGEIKWEIVQRSTPYNCGSRRCDLCLSEKLAIALTNPNLLLNKRSEMVSSCRHRSKYRCNKQLSILS